MSNVLKIGDLSRFSDYSLLQLSREEIRAIWMHLMTRRSPTRAPRAVTLRIRSEGRRRVRRSYFASPDETDRLVVTRGSLMAYGAYLRTLKGSDRFFAEMKGLSPDECALLMDWLNAITPPVLSASRWG